MNTSRWFRLALLGMALCFSACGKVNVEDLVSKFRDLKGTNWKEKIGQTFTVEGYLVFGETGDIMLVDSLERVFANAALPEESYILLENDSQWGQEILNNKDTYFGAFVNLKGLMAEAIDPVAKTMAELLGSNSLARLKIQQLPEIIASRTAGIEPPRVIDLCALNPSACVPQTTVSSKYAILFSGGINSTYAYSRYWNDLKFMYQTLQSKYGYSAENIVVIYKNGTGEDNTFTVDYPATAAGWTGAVSDLQGKMSSSDQLFFFATNHGGGWHQLEDKNYSGVSDGNNDEGDPFFYDETLFYYNTPGAISDDQLSGWINSIPFARLVAVIEPCFGGGLLRDLKGSNRVIVSASTEFEFSWALPPSYQYDAFSYYFTAAVNGATHTGTPVDADTDNDGDVSILEAFLYATNADTQPETPQYEDSGDGQSTSAPSVSGTDGGYGATVGL